jgi:lipopolysaccharide export system protein LptA
MTRLVTRLVTRLAVVAFCCVPSLAVAQRQRRCEILDFPNYPSTHTTIVKDTVTGKYNTFAAGGVFAKCRGQDVTIRGDSLESYGNQGIHYLIGNVHYHEARIEMDADRLTYYQAEERLVAEGNVRVRNADGSTMNGSRVEYYRAVPPIRTVARLDATDNPTFLLVTRDSAGRPPTETRLVANHVTSIGDSLFYAGGNVHITRVDVDATADSGVVNKLTEDSQLIGHPVVEGRGDRAFTMKGRRIDMRSRARKLQRVLSRDSASVVSKDITLLADTIDLRIDADKLQRAFAWGRRRAQATSPGRDIFADSIDVQMPNQKLREVHALRNAYAESEPDSTKLVSKERDWIMGDTLIARFDSIPATDTTSTPRPRELVATGNAASYYQIPSNKGRTERASINYVRGRQITVSFQAGQVQVVNVLDKAVGLFLEAADTTAKPPANGRGGRRPAARPAPASAVPLPRRPTGSEDAR